MSQAGIYISGANPTNPLQTLQGNTGLPVGPDGTGNIHLLGGTGVLVTGNPGANTLTINVTGGGITWNVINPLVPYVMSSNNGYIVTNSGSQAVLELPTAPTIGDTIKILAAGIGVGGINGGSWNITQTIALQQVQFASYFTTAGPTGVVYSNLQNDYIELLYIGSEIWVATGIVGNLTFL